MDVRWNRHRCLYSHQGLGARRRKKSCRETTWRNENRHEKAGCRFFFYKASILRTLGSIMSHWFEMFVNTSYQQALCCMILLEILTSLEWDILDFIIQIGDCNISNMSKKISCFFPGLWTISKKDPTDTRWAPTNSKWDRNPYKYDSTVITLTILRPFIGAT